MILCGSITNSELRARLLSLATDMGWDSWITHEPLLLAPMLEALSTPADAIVSDDRDALVALTPSGVARILLSGDDDKPGSSAPARSEADAATDQTLFVIDIAEDDVALRQHLFNCVNTTRLKSRFRESAGREPITRLPRHQELISSLINYRGAPTALLVV